jgi:hypothetical protein
MATKDNLPVDFFAVGGLLTLAALASAQDLQARLQQLFAPRATLLHLLQRAPEDQQWAIVCAFTAAQRLGDQQAVRLDQRLEAARKREDDLLDKLEEAAAFQEERAYLEPLHLRVRRVRALVDDLQRAWKLATYLGGLP